ncbi:MAG: hypothetical protein E7182_05950 [Erysipelotrichaceae bacterium]|nr:hypothetical protein [Erysipelotrichaceae bacterium]
MKKRHLLLVFACGMLLAACGEQPASSSSEESSSSASSVIPAPSEGSDVIDGSVIETNILEPEEIEPNKASVVSVNAALEIDEDVINTSYANLGLLVRQNAAGLIGFYSMIHRDYLIAPQFEPAWLSYSVYNNNNGHIPYFLRIQYEGFHYLIDAFGNKLLDKAEAQPDPSTYSYYVINEKFYFSLGSGLDRVHFEYAANGKATKINAIPDEAYEGPEFGEVFGGSKIDLTDYGKEGYELYRTNGGTYILYKEGAFVRANNLLQGESMIACFGTKVLVQRHYELPIDATDYDYFVPTTNFYHDPETENLGTKYRLETAWLDLETGSRTNVETRLLFTGAGTPIRNAEGMFTYFAASFYEIPADKLIAARHLFTRVLDGNLVLHDKVNDIMGIGLVQLDDEHYYSPTANIIFDADGKPITDLGNLNSRTNVPLAKGFLGTFDGKFGFVGYDGKVKAPFKYDQIYASEVLNNKVIGVRNGKFFRIDLTTGTEAFITDSAMRIDENVFRMEDENNFIFFNASGEITKFAKENLTGIVDAYDMSYLNDQDGRVLVARYLDPETGVSTFQYRLLTYGSISVARSSVGFIADGLEHQDGTTFDEREIAVVGDNMVHSNKNNSYRFVEFEATKTGDYFIFLPNALTGINAYNINIDELTGEASMGSYISVNTASYSVKSTSEYTSAYRVSLHEKDETHTGLYVFRIYSSTSWTYHQVDPLRIEYAEGYYDTTPLELDPELTGATFMPSAVLEPVDTIYAKLLYKDNPGWFNLTSGDEENPLLNADDPFGVHEESGDRVVALNFESVIKKVTNINHTFTAETIVNNTPARAVKLGVGETKVMAKYEGLSHYVYTRFAPSYTGEYRFSFSGSYGADADSLENSYYAYTTYFLYDSLGELISSGSWTNGNSLTMEKGRSVVFANGLYTSANSTTGEYYLSCVTATVTGINGYALEAPAVTLNASNYVYSQPRYFNIASSRKMKLNFTETDLEVTYYRIDEEGAVISSTLLANGDVFLDVTEGTDHGVLGVRRLPTSVSSSGYLSVSGVETLTYTISGLPSWAGEDDCVLFAYVYDDDTKTTGTWSKVTFTGTLGGFNTAISAPYGFFIARCAEGTTTPDLSITTGTEAGRVFNKSDDILFEEEKTDYAIGELKVHPAE